MLLALRLLAQTSQAHTQVSELSWEAITRHSSLSTQAQIEEALASGNPTLAASLVADAQRTNPHSVPLRALWLQTLAASGNWEAAYDISREQLHQDPTLDQHLAWTHWAALAAVRTGHAAEATALLRSLTRYPDENPASAVLLYNLAETQRLQGDVPSAIVNYQLSLSHAPTYPSAMLGLGAALEATGDVDAAHAILRRLLALDPALEVLEAPRFYLPQGQVHWLRALASEAAGDAVAARSALDQLARSPMANTHAAEVGTLTARLEARLRDAHADLVWIELPGCTPQRMVVTVDGSHAAVLCFEGQLRTGGLDPAASWHVVSGLQHAAGGRNLLARTAGIAIPSADRILVWSTSGERETVTVTRTGARAQRDAETAQAAGTPMAVSPDGQLWAVSPVTTTGESLLEVRTSPDGPATTVRPSYSFHATQLAPDRVAVRVNEGVEVIHLENGGAQMTRLPSPNGDVLRAWGMALDGQLVARAWSRSITLDRSDAASPPRRVSLPATPTGDPLQPTALTVRDSQTVVVGFGGGLLILPVP